MNKTIDSANQKLSSLLSVGAGLGSLTQERGRRWVRLWRYVRCGRLLAQASTTATAS